MRSLRMHCVCLGCINATVSFSMSVNALQASQALAALAQAEQASASALVETCLENLSISAMQLGAPGSSTGQVSDTSLSGWQHV